MCCKCIPGCCYLKLRALVDADRKPSAVKVYSNGAFLHHSQTTVRGFASWERNRRDFPGSTTMVSQQHRQSRLQKP